MGNPFQNLVALEFYLLTNSCKSLIACKSLWHCQICLLQGSKMYGKSVSNACGIVFLLACQFLQIFNTAHILVALRRWQICFLQEAQKLGKSACNSLWRCGIAKFSFCKKPKGRESWHWCFTCLPALASL